MNEDKNRALGWILGAALVVAALGLYLWLTAPETNLLSETYTVM